MKDIVVVEKLADDWVTVKSISEEAHEAAPQSDRSIKESSIGSPSLIVSSEEDSIDPYTIYEAPSTLTLRKQMRMRKKHEAYMRGDNTRNIPLNINQANQS